MFQVEASSFPSRMPQVLDLVRGVNLFFSIFFDKKKIKEKPLKQRREPLGKKERTVGKTAGKHRHFAKLTVLL